MKFCSIAMVIFQRLQNILLYRVKRFFFAMNWNVSQLILVVNYCTLTFLSNTDILYSMLIILAKFGIKTFFLKIYLGVKRTISNQVDIVKNSDY